MYIPPPIAFALGSKKYPRRVPFNKEIVRAVKFWEKETGIKFHSKILFNKFTMFDHKNIHLSKSDISSLFHELTHYKQQAGRRCVHDTMNWFMHFSHDDSKYYLMPSERNANREAKKLALKFRKMVLKIK